ncbi:hypothetical protein CEV34_2905 [Brucella pseudogrignonensis]|uniref:Uncharacterized protein n=1 Tax=Brucella pseudogrignonensis TaxID=419475 RepID=A0A256GEE3_9HYPH|nr:hypothetical protein CEV34_2905 [Brucella pseudogrignonensis]
MVFAISTFARRLHQRDANVEIRPLAGHFEPYNHLSAKLR